MSNEKHLEEGTGELSESKALLDYARSTTVLSEPRSPTLNRLTEHCSEDLSAITKRLKELADQKGAYKLKYRERRFRVVFSGSPLRTSKKSSRLL